MINPKTIADGLRTSVGDVPFSIIKELKIRLVRTQRHLFSSSKAPNVWRTASSNHISNLMCRQHQTQEGGVLVAPQDFRVEERSVGFQQLFERKGADFTLNLSFPERKPGFRISTMGPEYRISTFNMMPTSSFHRRDRYWRGQGL